MTHEFKKGDKVISRKSPTANTLYEVLTIHRNGTLTVKSQFPIINGKVSKGYLGDTHRKINAWRFLPFAELPSARKPVHISGKRWFQRTYGNTYHSVTIYYDDGSSEYLPREYGYGDYYLQRAFEHLGFENQPMYSERLELGITVDAVDVARQRDL